jgi:hypothetical protein
VRRGLLALALTAAAVAAPALAAAPKMPEPPRGRTGYVAPRLPADYLARLAKLPDWNGTWIQQAAPKLRPAHLVFDPDNFHEPPDDLEGKNGLVSVRPGSYMTAIPYKPEYLKEYMDNVAANADGRSIDKAALCVPYGMPRLMGGAPSGPEIIMTPDMVSMYFDFGSTVRHIYTDGRKHPEGESFEGGLNPRWNGHSIGRWEGDTLVVDTVGVYPGFYDQTSAPHSDQLRMTERIRLIDWNWLEDEMVIEDPVMFTKPWKVTRWYLRNGAGRYPDVGDNDCPPNQEIDFSEGYQRLILPAEEEAREEAERKAREGKK